MPRGESSKSADRAPGLAIWAALGVLVIAATLLLVWGTWVVPAQRFHGSAPPSPVVSHPAGDPTPELLAGLTEVPLFGLSNGSPGRPSSDVIADRLLARGYVVSSAGTGRNVRQLPLRARLTELDGACGAVVATVIDVPRSMISSARTDAGPAMTPMRGTTEQAVFARLCGGETLEIEGYGDVDVRIFVMPGLTPEIARGTHLPTPVAIAHAEAEALLLARGFTPSDEAAELRVPPSRTNVTFPVSPAAGCAPMVAVAWGASELQASDASVGTRNDGLGSGSMVGLVVCAAPRASSIVSIADDATAGATVYARAYQLVRPGVYASPSPQAPLHMRDLHRVDDTAMRFAPAPSPASHGIPEGATP